VGAHPISSKLFEVAKEMERIFSSFEVSIKSGRGVGITFTPVTRINSLLVVSSIPNVFEKAITMRRMLEEKKVDKITEREVYTNKEYIRRFVGDVKRFIEPKQVPEEAPKKAEKKKAKK
jgi:hypothetical protein